jgi:hypothetical protein
MKYTHKSFSVPSGGRDPKDCDHTSPWVVELTGRCVLCGEQLTTDPQGIYLLRKRAD